MPRSIHDMPDSSELTHYSGNDSPISRNVMRHAPFTLFVCALVAATLLVFSQAAFSTQEPRGIAATPQPAATRVAIQANVRVAPAQMHIYPTLDPRASLMQPVVDREGYVWFGEMRANKLARLDPAREKYENGIIQAAAMG
jgi:streptogramin lyase